jgi:RNA polymerase sigma-70 factor (ECF subfamily)
VARALAGDGTAARAIVERHGSVVRRCLGATFTGADLEDGVQSVLALAFERLANLREPSSLRSFLIGIALRFRAMERRRQRNRWRECLTSSGEAYERGESSDTVENIEIVACTRSILARLSPEAARVLEMRFVCEREMTEVAATMGVSLATAKRHLRRITARVRAMAAREAAIVEHLGPNGNQGCGQ